MRAQLLLVALLLGCATAEPAKEATPDSLPLGDVNAAILRLRAAGLELVQERDEAIELAKRYRSELQECDAGRRT